MTRDAQISYPYPLKTIRILFVYKMERDLGVIVHKSLKVSSQCNKVVKEAYSILGVINRCFLNKTKDILVPLYKSLVRSRLEYCVQAWRPYLVKDIELMERVQKRMTRMLPDLKNMSYPERLKNLDLTTLESRKLRFDRGIQDSKGF